MLVTGIGEEASSKSGSFNWFDLFMSAASLLKTTNVRVGHQIVGESPA